MAIAFMLPDIPEKLRPTGYPRHALSMQSEEILIAIFESCERSLRKMTRHPGKFAVTVGQLREMLALEPIVDPHDVNTHI